MEGESARLLNFLKHHINKLNARYQGVFGRGEIVRIDVIAGENLSVPHFSSEDNAPSSEQIAAFLQLRSITAHQSSSDSFVFKIYKLPTSVLEHMDYTAERLRTDLTYFLLPVSNKLYTIQGGVGRMSQEYNGNDCLCMMYGDGFEYIGTHNVDGLYRRLERFWC